MMNPLGRRLAALLCVALMFVGAGCQHRRAAVAAPPTGRIGFEFLEPRAMTTREATVSLQVGTPMPMVSPARPIEPLPKPEYPPKALAAHAGFATVGVRLTIDTTGRVSSVDSSLRFFSSPNPWSEEFRAAVDAAVSRWRFRPAQRVMVERVKDADGADDLAVRDSEPAEWVCDVAFTFTETGQVLTNL